MKEYDICFIGAGSASLYCAYKISKDYPKLNIIILEQKNRIGGRTYDTKWKGVNIVEGAGIIRLDKDKKLENLLQELNLKIHKYDKYITYSSKINQNIKPKDLVKEYKKSFSRSDFDRSKYTFKTWGLKIWSKEKYKDFVDACGFTDFENADPIDTIYDYGFEDVESGGKSAMVPWKNMILKMANIIGNHKIKKNSKVNKIYKHDSLWNIEFNHKKIVAKNVILGTTINPMKKMIKNRLLKQIKSQPFILVYAQLDITKSQEFINNIKGYIIVSNELQKIIPINSEKGIFLIAYADNENMIKVEKHKDDKEWFEQKIREEFNFNIAIKNLKSFIWKEGTHYYTPLQNEFKNRDEFLRKVQMPYEGLFCIGEGFSRNQGWTEGAIESVENIYNIINIK